MNFITTVRDYTQYVNDIYFPALGDTSFIDVLKSLVTYFFVFLKDILVYLLSFQWFAGFNFVDIISDFGTLREEIDTFIMKGMLGDLEYDTVFFFLQPAVSANNKLLLGFLNSFFLCLPISAINVITIRRLLIQGIPAGIASASGALLGHWLLTTGIVFGFRFIIFPWFSFEPFMYIIGIYLLVTIVHDMACQRSLLPINITQKARLIRIFLLSFALSWTEQSCIFQHFSSLTFSPQVSPLETFTSNGFVSHFNYSVGLLLGLLFFTTVFVAFTLWFPTFCIDVVGIKLSRWMNTMNVSLLVITLAFAITSIPYYGIDYMLAKPLGFLSGDKLMHRTFLTPDVRTLQFEPTKKKGERDTHDIITDVTAYDRGRYITELGDPQTYEDLNYQGDASWNLSPHRKSTAFRILSRRKRFTVGMFLKKQSQKEKEQRQKQIAYREQFKKPEPPKASAGLLLDYELLEEFVDHLKERQKEEKIEEESIEEEGKEKESQQEELENMHPYINHVRVPMFLFKENAQAIMDPILDAGFRFKEAQWDLDLTLRGNEYKPTFLKRFYNNYLYKFLLSIDIDLFIQRQPKNFKLSPEEETNLLTKREKLNAYQESLYAYEKLPNLETYLELFGDIRSHVNRVYDQQFKGTLHLIKRLFSLELNAYDLQEDETSLKRRVLKFDQLLYDDQLQPLLKKQVDTENKVGQQEDSSFHINEYLGTAKKGIFHEELKPPAPESEESRFNPFLEVSTYRPFYGGWSEIRRGFVLTNRLASRTFAGNFWVKSRKGYYTTPGANDPFDKYSPKKLKSKPVRQEELNEIYPFFAWPIPKGLINKIKYSSSVYRKRTKTNLLGRFVQTFGSKNDLALGYNLAYQPAEGNEKFLEFVQFDKESLELKRPLKTFPTYLKHIDGKIRKIFPPNRGGFIWPGFPSRAVRPDKMLPHLRKLKEK